MEDSLISPVKIGNTLKLIVFPGIISVLSLLIWRGVSQLQNDVSLLLADNNMQKVQINYLEKQVEHLNERVYGINSISQSSYNLAHSAASTKTINTGIYIPLAAIKTEIFDINDYIKFT